MISHLNVLRGSRGPRTLTLCCQVPACGCLWRLLESSVTSALHSQCSSGPLIYFADDGCARKFVVSGGVFFFSWRQRKCAKPFSLYLAAFTHAVSLSLSRDLALLFWESSVTWSIATLLQLAVWRFLVSCDREVGAPCVGLLRPWFTLHDCLLKRRIMMNS